MTRGAGEDASGFRPGGHLNSMDAVVAAVESVGTDAVAVSFESPPEFDARPGQFVRLGAEVDEEHRQRFYTVSSPSTAETFEVTVTVDGDEGGPFSPYLAAAEPGDAFDLDGPFGDAAYDGQEQSVVLAGGPGVGPAVAIGEAALSDGNGAAIVYRDSVPIHSERLDALNADGVPVTTLPADAALTDAVADAVAAGDTVFVYGFAEFVEDARAAVEAAPAEPATIHVESFG